MNKITLTFLALLGITVNNIVSAQNVTNQTAFYNQCISCVQSNTAKPNYYCNANKACYNGSQTNQTGCGNTMDYCLSNPTTTLPDYTINSLDIKTVKENLVINKGQSVQIKVRSQAEKSGFINITYDDYNKKTDNNKVLFYVYNNRADLRSKKFEMSYVDSVLLPQTSDDFIIWLGAQGDNFKINILASNSRNLITSLFAVAFMVVASLTIF